MSYPYASEHCSSEMAFVSDQKAAKHGTPEMPRNQRQMGGGVIVRRTLALWVDPQEGTHAPLPLHRSYLSVDGRNALMVGHTSAATMVGFLDSIPHNTIPDDMKAVKRVWKWIAKGI